MERYSIEIPFPGQYDVATIGNDGGGWDGDISAWSVGDTRNYFGNARYLESACRFRNVYLPVDSVIASAKLLFEATADIDTVVNSKITIQDSITALSFPIAGIYADFVARPRLATEIIWDGITNFGSAQKLETPDFSPLIQGLVDTYGLINLGAIVIFWGDREGRTPIPPAFKANSITAIGYGGHTFRLRVEFDSAVVISTPHPSISYLLDNISAVKYKLDDRNIINDVRVLIPQAPADYYWARQDKESITKHGRRTKVHSWPGTNAAYYAPALSERQISKCKDPVPTMAAKVIPTTDIELAKHLATRISDKFTIDIDRMGMLNKFWIDSKILTLETGYITAEYGLTEIMAFDNMQRLFEVDVDRVDDTEEVIG
jgi:hypothetical protein